MTAVHHAESIKWTNVFLVSCFFEGLGSVTILRATLKTVPSIFCGGTRGLKVSLILSSGDELETSGVAGDSTGGV